MRRHISLAIMAIIISAGVMACGVESNNAGSLAAAPDVSGPWRIVMLPAKNDCSPLSKGFALDSPIDVPMVTQNGNVIAASFTLNGKPVALSGTALGAAVNMLLEQFGMFMESFGGTTDGSAVLGTFNGQELPNGCAESGLFVAAVKNVSTPVVTGEWNITMTGAAVNCDSPLDEGPFAKFVPVATVISTSPGIIESVYEDPALVFNILDGIVVGNNMIGVINDVFLPPSRVATVTGVIEPLSQTIMGTLTGNLAFANGFCDISGGFFSALYK